MNNKKHKFNPFVLIEKQTLKNPEWKKLKTAEKLIYIYIKANYNGSNNGDISFTYSQATDEFSSATISRALKGLELGKWIERTKIGGLYRYYNKYRLTGIYDRIK